MKSKTANPAGNGLPFPPKIEPGPIEPGAPESVKAGLGSVCLVAANAKLLQLGHGLYALNVAASRSCGELVGTTLPVTLIADAGMGNHGSVDVLGSAAVGPAWLGPEGGTVVVRAPRDGGFLLITTYRQPDQEGEPLEIQVTRLDRSTLNGSSDAASLPAPADTKAADRARPRRRDAPTEALPRDVQAEIVLHVERKGDCHFTAGEWIGERGKKLRIEAFSVRPLEHLSASDIEYKAFGPNRRETPWVSDARLCGSRGRGMPLTGFAVRLAPALDGRYDVVYQGAFFDSGVVGPRRNGEPCLAPRLDDPLEAVNIRLIERPAS